MLNKRMFAVLSGIIFVLGIAFSSEIETPANAATTSSRLWGDNRYETAVNISKAGWTTSNYAIIVSGDDFSDALCAAPLSKMYNAPILLVQKNVIDDKTKDELKQLKVKNAIIIGGAGVISNEVESTIKSLGISIERFSGKDRYETSVKIAEKLGVNGKVIVATGSNFADVLSIAPVAAAENIPILLTEKENLPDSVKDFVDGNKNSITKSYVLGGPSIVSDSVKNLLKGPERIAGGDRFETNVNIMKVFENELNFKNIYIAVGDGPSETGFADVLAGTAIAAKTSSPVILTNNGLPEVTAEYLKNNTLPNNKVVVLGGEAVVPNSVIRKIEEFKVKADTINKNGEVKGSIDSTKQEVINNNVNVEVENAALINAKISGNVYINKDGAKLSNVIVDGTVFIDPGEKGSVTLEKVKAKKIRVLSGAKNSIHLINTQADNLVIESDNPNDLVRVICTGTTNIGETKLKSYAVVDVEGGSLGVIYVVENKEQEKTIQFSGKFNKEIVLNSNAKVEFLSGAKVDKIVVNSEVELKCNAGAEVSKVDLKTSSKDKKVKLEGAFKFVEINKEGKLMLADNAKVDAVKANVDFVIDTVKTSSIDILEISKYFKGEKVEIAGQGKVNNIQVRNDNVKVFIKNELKVDKIEAVNKKSIEGSVEINNKIQEKKVEDIGKNSSITGNGTTTGETSKDKSADYDETHNGGSSNSNETPSENKSNLSSPQITTTVDGGKVTFNIVTKDVVDNTTLTIILENSKGNSMYIDQMKVLNNKCLFSTVISSGAYSARLNIGGKLYTISVEI